MTHRKLSARILAKRPIADGFLEINEYRFEVEKFGGGTQVLVREVMERGHAVGVLGYDPRRDEVVLVSEFRPGRMVNGEYPFSDNVTAGVVNQGESPVEAAVREMKEETGLELRAPVLVHPGAYVSSGGTSETVAVVVGLVDSAVAGGIHGNADESEDICTVVLPAQEFIDRVRRADITDFKTLVAGYWLAEHRERLQETR